MKLRSGLVLTSAERRNPMRGVKKPNANTITAKQVKSLITYTDNLEDILCEAGTSRPSRPSRASRSLKARQAASAARGAAKLGQPRRSGRIAELRTQLGEMGNLCDFRVVNVGQQVDIGPLIDMGQIVEVQLAQAAGTDYDSMPEAEHQAAEMDVPGSQLVRGAATGTRVVQYIEILDVITIVGATPGLTDAELVGRTAATLGALNAVDSQATPVADSAEDADGDLSDLETEMSSTEEDEQKTKTEAGQARTQEGCRRRFWTNVKSALMRWVSFA
ncbi:uncharacterized protein [Drosophila virilis]|uniref:Uncharacterized protein, isoform A n=1 Tax=Drosophila virilis TaxID=7244 RepID=B4M887_DROVI|nr:uncharacterized protein LOC6633294 isoform X1 [Drosophila virilis]EDW62363.1 uncharacterized protein Dvir_GJ16650, isoform A [Drosophila virilis]